MANIEYVSLIGINYSNFYTLLSLLMIWVIIYQIYSATLFYVKFDDIIFQIVSIPEQGNIASIGFYQPETSDIYRAELKQNENIGKSATINSTFNAFTITIISSYSFSGSKLNRITFPSTINEMHKFVFKDCSINEVDLSFTQITEISTETFANSAKINTIKLPKNASTIGSLAMQNCVEMVLLDLSNTVVTRVEDMAFYNMKNLKTCNLPHTLTYIGANCFFQCTNLQKINIPDNSNLISFSKSAFNGCSKLVWDCLPSYLQEIQSQCFYKCNNLVEITLPISLKILGSEVFGECKKLSIINFRSTLSELPEGCFVKCVNLKSIKIESQKQWKSFIDLSSIGVTYIGDRCFTGCLNVKNISLISGKMNIGKSAFKNSGLKSINLQYVTMELINESCFELCRSLSKIILPNSLLLLDMYSLYDTNADIYYYGSNNIKVDRALNSKHNIYTLFDNAFGFEDTIQISPAFSNKTRTSVPLHEIPQLIQKNEEFRVSFPGVIISVTTIIAIFVAILFVWGFNHFISLNRYGIVDDSDQ